jgi:formate hydrogenlyase subunit 6/NADH:ubiquinone oxidoreductase subunit I
MKFCKLVLCIYFYEFYASQFRNYFKGIKGNVQRSVLRMDMAPFKKPRAQNSAGNLFVDESCIDCDVCRWMCPSVFSRIGVKSAVYFQPLNEV